MPFERRNLEIEEISACETGANQGAKIFFFKSEDKESQMDVETIEDADLKKEVEALIKEHTDLQTQLDELQKNHKELVEANEAKDKEDEPIEKKVEELPEDMRKAWNESQELIKKAQEAADMAKEEVAEIRKEALQKEISETLDKMPRLTSKPEDRKEIEDMLLKMEVKDRATCVEAFEKAELLAGKSDSLMKELGGKNTESQSDVADKVDVLAKELIAKSDEPLTEVQARVKVREMHPELRDEQEIS